MASGVSRLAGSLTRSRAKFCASARTLPALDRRLQTGVSPATVNASTRFLVVARLVAVRLEIAQNRAFDRGRGEVVAGEFGIQDKGDRS